MGYIVIIYHTKINIFSFESLVVAIIGIHW